MAQTASITNARDSASHAECVVYIYLFSVAQLMVIGRSYLANIPTGTSLAGWAMTLLAYTANFFFLAIGPAVLSLPVLLVRRRWFTLTLAPLLFGLLSVFIYADSITYVLWRFHFNGMIWNLLTTPGAGDTVTAGTGTVTSAICAIVVILGSEFGFAWLVLPRLGRNAFVPRWRTPRGLITFCSSVLLLMALDKILYDVGDLADDLEVIRLHAILPFYQAPTVRRLARNLFGIDTARKSELKMVPAHALDYPKSPIRLRAGGPRPNVLLLVIEGGRFDMLTMDVMPHLTRWAEDHLVFDNNYSSGNATRYGIFGLLYGIHGTYWQSVLNSRQGPVLVHSLKQLGYHFRILSCTDLNYPEFRSTAFIEISPAVTDHWGEDLPRVDRDKVMTDELIKFIHEKPVPFFGFVFYDASHQPYRYPPQHAVFDTGTLTDQLNYIQLTHPKPGDMKLAFNRYRNSLHYIDEQIGRVLQTLREEGAESNTLVFIVGDHGEAFNELGLFGHDSAFDRYQTRTLCAAGIPGEPPQRIERMTSHEDVPSTILTYMGVKNPLTDYTQGLPLTTNAIHPFLLVSCWNSGAVVDSNSITPFGLEAYNRGPAVLDTNDVPLPNPRQALGRHRQEMLAAMQEMRQFMNK
ncbi:MAG TPA: sulfatase-like hydrolase/transferase [Verrucomicrobiae bacterium]|nr:sulfatase-like hydrolase/transferase [Verrucomicrobiae bacterium]